MQMSSSAAVQGRRAGVIWLVATIAGGFALGYVRNHVYMPGDPAATAQALLADVFRFRLAIVAALVSQVAMLFLALELYRLFAPDGRVLARVLLVSMLVSVALGCLDQLPNLIALLLLVPDPYLQVFPQAQREAMTLLLLRVQNGSGQALLEIFWTPFYVAFGLLALRTRALPRILGVLLVAMGIGFAVNILDKLLVPQFQPTFFLGLAMILGALGAIPTMLWLLVRGIALPVAADA